MTIYKIRVRTPHGIVAEFVTAPDVNTAAANVYARHGGGLATTIASITVVR
jgi:hypothetical protein